MKKFHKLLEGFINTRAKDCIVWTMFKDTKEKDYHINKYCEKNCQYKCLKGLNYKKGYNA